VSYPADPPAASTSVANHDPPPARNAFVADGRWHRFGENAQSVTANAKVASPQRSARPLTRAAFAGDSKWHHFGGGNVRAPANHDNSKVASPPNSSSARVALAAHFQAANASGK
jgi:hypothetical protein